MQDFREKVAVVTGAASGIGRGLVDAFAAEGMKLVLADIEPEPLGIAARELADGGAEVLAVRTDTGDAASVEELAAAAYARFGAVHILCNNAGVSGGGGALWETSEADWTWVLGVNLMGVVHGIRAFVPRMLAGGEEGHIVNTSSVLGLSTGPGSVYGVSKHGVTRLTEGLYHDLQAAGARIGVSVLCPGLTATRIIEAERNRPAALANVAERTPEAAARRQAMQAYFLAEGMPPAETARIVLEAIRAERFYILPHPDIKTAVERRMRDILEDRNPTPPPAPAGGLAARAMAAAAQARQGEVRP